MPAEILNSGPLQRIAPSLGVDLDDWTTLVGEYMGWVIALPPLQHFQGGLIEQHGYSLPFLRS